MFSPGQANFPSLLGGVIVQFVGNRYWVFNSEGRSLAPQIVAFSIVEGVSFAMNWVVFHLLLKFTPVYYPLARWIGVTFVFFCFSYPLWHWIFRPARPENSEKAFT